MPGKAAASGSPWKRSPAGPRLPSLLGSYRRVAVRGLGAEQYRSAQDMPVGGLHENRDALAGSGRIERECRLAAAPLAERRQAFDTVCIVERAARILTGTDLRPARRTSQTWPSPAAAAAVPIVTARRSVAKATGATAAGVVWRNAANTVSRCEPTISRVPSMTSCGV